MDFASQLAAPFSDSEQQDAPPQQPPQESTLVIPDSTPAAASAPATTPAPAPKKVAKKTVRKKRETRTFPVETSYVPPTKALKPVASIMTKAGIDTGQAPLVVHGRAFTSAGTAPRSGKESLFSSMMTDTIHVAKIAHLCRKAEDLGISAADAIEVAIDLFNVHPTQNIKVDGRSVTVD